MNNYGATSSVICGLVLSVALSFVQLVPHGASEPRRSPKWPAVRAAYLKDHPRCEVCGDDDGLQVHHVIPFHIDPRRELDRDNLITLCTGPTNCHLMFGHLKNYRSWNPDVRKDAAIWREKIRNRPRHEEASK